MRRHNLYMALLLAACAGDEVVDELADEKLELGPVATRIGMAGNTTFAIGADGTGYGWGLARLGTISGTSIPNRKMPGPLLNFPANAKNLQGIAGGEEFACGWKKATVWCWGSNMYGELANGGVDSDLHPAATTPQPWADDVLEVTAGMWHACVLTKGKELYCWGENESGQLGTGDKEWRFTPTLVKTDVIAAEASGAHTCAVDSTGQVFCWGWNDGGKLGTGSTEALVLSPTPVPGATGAVDLTGGGYHQCYLTAGGKMSCWGQNTRGQLGTGNTIASTQPKQVLTQVASMTAGFNHTCAVKKNGKVACWGSNLFGETGTGREIDELAPAPVPGLKNIAQVVSSWNTTCSLDTSGQIKCWGLNHLGQVGNNSEDTPIATPTAVTLP